ncbi:membrane protein [Chryseobacterium sp. P1-3]|uniref:SPW repeat domain-containing protein n=2 Tax=Chryseobacterium TaxID=59732 RepID=UPI0004E78E93|nr:membrane protein [Chryseobacterium sp. P1-3]
MISSKIHAVLDYLMGALLIAIPWLLGFADHSAATVLPVILGASTIIYSLLTDYEYAIAPAFSFQGHLLLDLMSAALLLVSPWLFGFNETIYWPHFILGAFEIVIVLLTTKTPPDTKFTIRST